MFNKSDQQNRKYFHKYEMMVTLVILVVISSLLSLINGQFTDELFDSNRTTPLATTILSSTQQPSSKATTVAATFTASSLPPTIFPRLNQTSSPLPLNSSLNEQQDVDKQLNRPQRQSILSSSQLKTNAIEYFRSLLSNAIPLSLNNEQTKIFLIAPVINPSNNNNFNNKNNDNFTLNSNSNQTSFENDFNSNENVVYAGLSQPIERRKSYYLLIPNETNELTGRSASGDINNNSSQFISDFATRNNFSSRNNDNFTDINRNFNGNFSLLTEESRTSGNDSIHNPFASAPYQSSNELIDNLIQNIFSDLTLQSLPPEEVLFGKLPERDGSSRTPIDPSIIFGNTSQPTFEGDSRLLVAQPETRFLPIQPELPRFQPEPVRFQPQPPRLQPEFARLRPEPPRFSPQPPQRIQRPPPPPIPFLPKPTDELPPHLRPRVFRPNKPQPSTRPPKLLPTPRPLPKIELPPWSPLNKPLPKVKPALPSLLRPSQSPQPPPTTPILTNFGLGNLQLNNNSTIQRGFSINNTNSFNNLTSIHRGINRNFNPNVNYTFDRENFAFIRNTNNSLPLNQHNFTNFTLNNNNLTNSNNFQPLQSFTPPQTTTTVAAFNFSTLRFPPIPPRYQAGVEYSDNHEYSNVTDQDLFVDLNRLQEPSITKPLPPQQLPTTSRFSLPETITTRTQNIQSPSPTATTISKFDDDLTATTLPVLDFSRIQPKQQEIPTTVSQPTSYPSPSTPAIPRGQTVQFHSQRVTHIAPRPSPPSTNENLNTTTTLNRYDELFNKYFPPYENLNLSIYNNNFSIRNQPSSLSSIINRNDSLLFNYNLTDLNLTNKNNNNLYDGTASITSISSLPTESNQSNQSLIELSNRFEHRNLNNNNNNNEIDLNIIDRYNNIGDLNTNTNNENNQQLTHHQSFSSSSISQRSKLRTQPNLPKYTPPPLRSDIPTETIGVPRDIQNKLINIISLPNYKFYLGKKNIR